MARDTQSREGLGENHIGAAGEAGLSARLTRLDERLSKSRRLHGGHDLQEDDDEKIASVRASGLALGFRLSSEFVAAVIVGAAIGWVFDHFLPTSPWGLIVFLLAGFAAGLLRLIKDAGAASN